ncbi:quinone-oxidoreductase QR2-like [Lotus japonicus]|uniref:quinone-oxidoreductase QR2-like n=1 Tax=Lotus japonicus TaxID=34305 RepID=UPI00258EBDB6|nr:quinone-oxidoreductase QR2-like [Lotus japonicus]
MQTTAESSRKRPREDGGSSSMAAEGQEVSSSSASVDEAASSSSSCPAAAKEASSSSSSCPAAAQEGPSNPVRVFIVFYPMHGQVERLARRILDGVHSVQGVEAKLWAVPEPLAAELRAPTESDVSTITADEFLKADCVLFGFPARFGMMASQFKAFLETTELIAKETYLATKPAGIFYSSNTPGSGQETAALTAVTQLAHLGMILVPIGYPSDMNVFQPQGGHLMEVKGGSPYGTGTYTGVDGSKQPTPRELDSAFRQGRNTAKIAKQLKDCGFSQRCMEDIW